MSPIRTIDWGTAQRVGELVAGSPPYGGPPGRSVQPLAHEFARRVSDYTGLDLPAELPAAGDGRPAELDRGESAHDATVARSAAGALG